MDSVVICRIIHVVRGKFANRVIRIACLIVMYIVSGLVQAQDVTIINQYGSEEKGISEENYVLKSVKEYRYVVNEYELSNTGPRSHLEQMIRYGLRSYVDNQIHGYDGRVEVLVNPTDFEIAATAIVRNAFWIHDQEFESDFDGFVNPVLRQVADLQEIDGYQLNFGDRDMMSPANGEVGLYAFQRMVYDLKTEMEEQVLSFLNQVMPETNERGYDESDSPLLSSEDYRIPKDNSIEAELLNLEPAIDFSNGKKPKKKKKEEPEELPFSERIVDLLEENNRILANYNNRFEDIQGQINEIRNERAVAGNEELKGEIAELRNMIQALGEGKTISEPDGTTTSMPEGGATLIFDKNSHELNMAHQAQLNKVVDILRNERSYSALITGYADKTGNAEFNAWISKQRAAAVKEYLIGRGIANTRLVLNFLGDAESQYANPADRKVEVQYIENTAGY